MYERRCLARLAAGASATVLMTVGAFIPAYAGNDDNTNEAQAGGSHGAEVSAEARADAAVAAHSRSGHSGETTSGSVGATVSTGSDHSQGNASTRGSYNLPQPESNADQNSGGANAGSCADGTAGSYCSTRNGSPSLNGQGGGKAVGKPCAGCVGKADNKNPPGQYPDGTDHNAGYECDTNKGIGKTNPAHTGCKPTPPKPPVVVPEKPKPPVVVPEKPKPPVVVPEEKPKPQPPAVAPVEQPEAEVVPAAVPAPAEVAPAEAVAPAPAVTPPAAVAPAAGALPPTGAEDYTLPILAGLVFLTAGGALVARRRLQPDS
jgi:LPXTG-motif cell wall-anchored protein